MTMETSTRWAYVTLSGFKSAFRSISYNHFTPSGFKKQQNIVQKLDALSAQTKKLEAIYQQHINDLDELKKSILQKAFNGELNTEKSRRDAMIIAKENISHTNPEGVK